MSSGALSEDAGVALARGAELASPGICFGEGSMLDNEQQANSRYLEESAKQLHKFLEASVDLMKIIAWVCGHARLRDFNINDLTTWKREMAELAGIHYCGVADLNGKTK